MPMPWSRIKGLEAYLHPFLTSALGEGRWPTLRCGQYTRGTNPQPHSTPMGFALEGVCALRDSLGLFGLVLKFLPSPGWFEFKVKNKYPPITTVYCNPYPANVENMVSS